MTLLLTLLLWLSLGLIGTLLMRFCCIVFDKMPVDFCNLGGVFEKFCSIHPLGALSFCVLPWGGVFTFFFGCALTIMIVIALMVMTMINLSDEPLFNLCFWKEKK